MRCLFYFHVLRVPLNFNTDFIQIFNRLASDFEKESTDTVYTKHLFIFQDICTLPGGDTWQFQQCLNSTFNIPSIFPKTLSI